MKRLIKLAIGIAVAIAGALILVALIWRDRDRTGMLNSLCEAGLPNFSRPGIVKADKLGCVILSARKHVSGVLLSGFEASNLIRSDLPPLPQKGDRPGTTWWTCNQTKGCDHRLDNQLGQRITGLCGIGLAHVEAYGWATETPGSFGHLGSYSREFFVDEVVAVGPPPATEVKHMQGNWLKIGLDDCP